jgi:Na+/melibiose symporter-like transporter
LGVAHQAWGAALPRCDAERSRLFAWREGAGLVGVLVASALPAVAGWTLTSAALALFMALGWWAWWHAPRPPKLAAAEVAQPSGTAHPPAQPGATRDAQGRHAPWAHRPFRRLMGVFVLNGIAGAIPATLVVLFMTDRLGASGNAQAALLSTYFACAALGLPLWLYGVRRWGVAATWAVGMVLAVAAFSGAVRLGSGDVWAFGLVCALSGLTLGADLALPSALLARVLDEHPSARAHRGQYFGWWALAAKLNLALAAGLALPLLGLWGYQPGTPDGHGLAALSLAYGALPGGLKLMAAALLYSFFIHPVRHLKVPPC